MATREESRARRIVVKTRKNPRREGTKAHEFYDAMTRSRTVDQYLSKFKGKRRRDAILWLNSSRRQKHVQLVAA